MINPDRFDYANDQVWQAMKQFNEVSGVISNKFPVRVTPNGIEPDTRQLDGLIYQLNAAELDREFKIEQDVQKNKEHLVGAPKGKGFSKFVHKYYIRLRRALASD